MLNILNIVKSRFIKGENLPEWYEQRLQMCSNCPMNSKNIEQKDKSSVRKGWELIAGAHCTDPSCGCTITEKAKIEEEFCPQNKWQAIEDVVNNQLNIVTKSNRVVLTFNKKLNKYIADYGEIPYKFDSNIELIVLDKDIRGLRASTSCGCTTAQPKQIEEGTELIVRYDTLRVGKFEKAIKLLYTQNDTLKQTIVNIRGTVKKEN